MRKKTYEEFKAKVDEALIDVTGMDLEGFPDSPLKRWYDEGKSVKQATLLVLRWSRMF